MLRIDKIDDDNIRIRQDSIDVKIASVFFASVGNSGLVIVSPKAAGAYRSFSEKLENMEINGVNGSDFGVDEALKELNSFVGNFRKAGGTAVKDPTLWGEITGDVDDQADLVTLVENIFKQKSDLANFFTKSEVTNLLKNIPHKDLLNRSDSDAHLISSITGLSSELSNKIEDVEFLPIFRQTNVGFEENRPFTFAAKGQNGKTYFSSDWLGGVFAKGIWVEESRGVIKPTNQTGGNYHTAEFGQNGKLYFIGHGSGICCLEDDGTIKQLYPTLTFGTMAMGSDNKLYFIGGKIAYLDDDDVIKIIVEDTWNVFGTGSINRASCAVFGTGIYFATATGVFRFDILDRLIYKKNEVSPMNAVFKSDDGTVYFLGSNSESGGVRYLDTTDMLIKPTNKSDGNFYYAKNDKNGVLYFCRINNVGIWYRDKDGQIKPTNKTNGNFYRMTNGRDGRMYFCGDQNTGMYYKEDDGIIRKLEGTPSGISFRYAIISDETETLYLLTQNGGILYVEYPTYVRDSDKWIKSEHKTLLGSGEPNCHPVSSITGLEAILAGFENRLAALELTHN